MNILLINPPFHRLIGMEDSYFPIGLGYLASSLDKAGFYVKIYNAENARESLLSSWSDNNINAKLLDQHKFYKTSLKNKYYYVWSEVIQIIDEYVPDVVGITAMTPKFSSALMIASICKNKNKDCYVVMGGPHPTIQPDETLANEYVDFVIRGEGERSIVELCKTLDDKNLMNLKNIAGLSYKENNTIKHNQNRELIEKLDDLSFPARELCINPDLYLPQAMGHLTGSRGCPYRCGFCGAQQMWTRKVRFRSIDNFLSEIKQIVEKYQINDFYFWDDSFTVNRKRIINLCERLKDEFNINWGCTTRVNLLDEELLKSMKSAGCWSIDIGIESGSARILQLIKKDITIDQILDAVSIIKKNNIMCNAFFMVGFPEENEEDIRQTINLMKNLDVSRIAFSIFTPYPGCELYEKAENLGLVSKNQDWGELSHHSPNNYFMKNIDRDRFDILVNECVKIVDEHNGSI